MKIAPRHPHPRPLRISNFGFRLSPRPPVSSFVFRLSSFPKAFSLVEVLLAIFILGVGLIMVASVFPVGANWTRQTTEDSVGQTMAQNALAVIKTHYGPGGDLHDSFNSDFFYLNAGVPAYNGPPNVNSVLLSANPFQLQGLPRFTLIPSSERAYQFGSSNPFPAANPQGCTYFWTALVRLNPAHRGSVLAGIQPASSYNYDLYILVFRKGEANQSFPTPASNEVSGTRTTTGMDLEYFIPPVVYANYKSGAFDANSAVLNNAIPPAIGQIGIGAFSGTVFRQTVDVVLGNKAFPRPPLANNNAETVIFAPPANGTNASPLIYVYQTTLTF
jgi:prepilin-type N-terminal cleavage/methylation domain-containing protein